MPTFLILRGYCGAGKSTLAKAFMRKHKYSFLEFDYCKWDLTGYQTRAEDTALAWKSTRTILKVLFAEKRDVLLEGALEHGSTAQDSVEALIRLARRAGYRVIPVIVIADYAVCLQRMRKRKHVVPKPAWQKLASAQANHPLPNEVVLDVSTSTAAGALRAMEHIVRNTPIVH